MHYKVEVVPNVVLLNDVFVERHVLVLKGTSRETCACGGGEGVCMGVCMGVGRCVGARWVSVCAGGFSSTGKGILHMHKQVRLSCSNQALSLIYEHPVPVLSFITQAS